MQPSRSGAAGAAGARGTPRIGGVATLLTGALAGLAGGAAMAQSTALVPAPAAPLVLTAPPTLGTLAPPPTALAAVPGASRLYLRNEADTGAAAVENTMHPAAFGVWRTDPRLVAGIDLTPRLALEAGYSNLFNRGTFYADGALDPQDAAGALGVKGYNSYLAAKVNLPVTERLQAYGKAGVAYSEFNHHGALMAPGLIDPATMRRSYTNGDTGSYVGAGAEYKLNDKASVSGAYQRHGDAAKWGPANSNNDGVSAKVRLGF